MAAYTIKSTAVLEIARMKPVVGKLERRAFLAELYASCSGFDMAARFEHSAKDGLILECVISTVDETTIPAMIAIGEKFGSRWSVSETPFGKTLRIEIGPRD